MPRPKGEVSEAKILEDSINDLIEARRKAGLDFDNHVVTGRRVEFFKNGFRIRVINILGVVPTRQPKPRKKRK